MQYKMETDLSAYNNPYVKEKRTAGTNKLNNKLMNVSLSLRCIKKKGVRWRKGSFNFRLGKKLIKEKESALTNLI